jgi:hypothetical protein
MGHHVTTLVLLCLGWIAGLWAAAQLNQPAWAWLGFAGLAAGSLILLRAERRLRWPLLCALALGLGAARYEAARPPLGDPHFVASYDEAGGAILDGVIADDPQSKDGQVALRVEAASILPPTAAEPIPVQGLVLVSTAEQSASRLAATGDPRFHYGDRVRVYGALETPPNFEGFSYRERQARFGIYAQVRGASVSFVAARAGNPAWQGLHDFKDHALSVLARRRYWPGYCSATRRASRPSCRAHSPRPTPRTLSRFRGLTSQSWWARSWRSPARCLVRGAACCWR